MEVIEEFKTVASVFETKLKEKGSLFLGQVYPVTNQPQAEIILTEVRKKFYDATHHCYAMMTIEGNIKYSDDGEPSGTAGLRILNAVQHFKVQNVLLIVIRYFGGVKLGVGPLGKAYYNSAYMTLSESSIITKVTYRKLKLVFDFPESGQVHHLLSLFHIRDIRNLYNDECEMEFMIRLTEVNEFIRKKEELLRNKVHLKVMDELVYL